MMKKVFGVIGVLLVGVPVICWGGVMVKAPVAVRGIVVLEAAGIKDAELVTFTSLQGQIARWGNPQQIYVNFPGSGYAEFLGKLERDYGVKVLRGMKKEEILKGFAKGATGYVLYDAKNRDSIQVATMRAHLNGGALVEKKYEKAVVAATGWKLLEDVSEARLEAFWKRKVEGLNVELPAEHRPEFAAALRDYLVFSGSVVSYEMERPEWVMEKVPVRDRVMLGWGNTKVEGGEAVPIKAFSRMGAYNIPTSSSYNLTVLSAFEARGKLEQRAVEVPVEEDVKQHLVAFLLTDGDNLNWNLKGFATGKKWFGSPLRGKFAMNYGIAPALAEVAPVAAEWFYEKAKREPNGGDYFVCGPSGVGYFYPSFFPKNLLGGQTEKLAGLMGRMGLRYVQIIDFDAADRGDLWREYLKHEEIGGLVLIDYAPYHKYRGKLSWVEGKPVASLRFLMWEGLKGCANDEVAKSINAMPRDLTRGEGYSIVGVHCWSKGLEDVQAVIEKLGPGVKVVTLDVLMETMGRKVRR